jgi:hypothetical protein
MRTAAGLKTENCKSKTDNCVVQKNANRPGSIVASEPVLDFLTLNLEQRLRGIGPEFKVRGSRFKVQGLR